MQKRSYLGGCFARRVKLYVWILTSILKYGVLVLLCPEMCVSAVLLDG